MKYARIATATFISFLAAKNSKPATFEVETKNKNESELFSKTLVYFSSFSTATKKFCKTKLNVTTREKCLLKTLFEKRPHKLIK